MCKAARFSRHAKQVTDRAISGTYRELATAPRQRAAYSQLLRVARSRSTLLVRPKVFGTRVAEVDALRNLAAFATAWLRPAQTWPGETGSCLRVVSSLARHLLGNHEVPRFLASAWFGSDSDRNRRRRAWVIHHSRGRRFRDLALPMPMTRAMEHVFLRSADHLSIEVAMRRAELSALGASAGLIDAVVATRLGTDLSNAKFWRTVMVFFVDTCDDTKLHLVGPIIDFIQFVRHETLCVHGPDGIVALAPVQPSWSIKGRTLRSVLRLVENWHRGLGSSPRANSYWSRSRYQPMVFQDPVRDPDTPPVRWTFIELTNSDQLRREGAALRHCVASYAGCCFAGRSRIWSLRRGRGESPDRSILTIEIHPATGKIVQARGIRNRRAWGKPLRLLTQWAAREKLRLAI